MPKCIIYCRSISRVALLYNMFISAFGNEEYIKRKTEFFGSNAPCATALRNKKHVSEFFSQMNSILRIVVATSAPGIGVKIPDL